MAQACDICGKKPIYGNRVSHANNKRRRRWLPNLKSVRSIVNGMTRTVRLCTRCIRSEKLAKASSARRLNKSAAWNKAQSPSA